jgi:hypothetical protein
MPRNDRTPLANHVGQPVCVRGFVAAFASPAPPFTVALLRDLLVTLADGSKVTEYGLEDPRNVQALPLPPALRAIRRGAPA